MNNKYILFLTTLLVALFLSSCTRKDKAYSIAVFDPFGPKTEKAALFSKSLKEAYGDTAVFMIDCHHLEDGNFFLENSDSLYLASKKRMLTAELNSMRKQNCEPDLIVLYGDWTAHAAAQLDDPWLHEKPVVCIGIIDPHYKGLLRQHPNVTVMEMRPGIKQTVDLIRDMGALSWIVTTLDSGYVDTRLRAEALTQLADTSRYRANIYLTEPDSFQTVDIRDSLHTILIPLSYQDRERNWHGNSAMGKGFDYDYMIHTSERFTTYLELKDDPFSDHAHTLPLGYYYSTQPEYFNNRYHGTLNSCLGGYMCPFHVMVRELKTCTDKILLDGVSVSDIPWSQHQQDFWMDWALAQKLHPYASDFPDYIHFINLPWRDRSPLLHRVYTIWGPILSSLLLFIIVIVALSIVIDRFIQDRRIMKASQLVMQKKHHSDMLSSVGRSYFWRCYNDDTVVFNDSFYTDCNSSPRPISRNALLRCLPYKQRKRVIDFSRSKEAGNITMEVSFRHPVSGIEHQLMLRIFSETEIPGIRSVGLVMVVDDMYNARKEREETMRLGQEASIKESFFASMGHEIRTPLNAIMGFSNILFDMYHDLSPEERQQYLDIIMQNNDNLLGIIEGLINGSDENGEVHFELSRKDVPSLMNELYLTHTVIVPERLEFHFEQGPDCYIMCNRSAMLQVVSNFMNNAIKFTEKGAITLGWTIRDDSNVEIYVEDTGIGIKEEHLDSVFKKFHKEDSHSAGAGIGLPLCKRLVEEMNGTIAVTSTYGRGSRFSIIVAPVK